MATPMETSDAENFWCCQCWDRVPNEYASFEVDNWPELVHINVCFGCRMAETYWMIKKFAGEGS